MNILEGDELKKVMEQLVDQTNQSTDPPEELISVDVETSINDGGSGNDSGVFLHNLFLIFVSWFHFLL